MSDEDLREAILECLPIEGTYELGNGYIDTDRMGIDNTVNELFVLIRECEQDSYKRGRAVAQRG